MLDFLFGGSSATKKRQQQRTPHPFPSSSSSSAAASSSSTFPPSSPYGAGAHGDEGAYDDVALGGGDLGGGGMATQSRNSLSGPPASDGAFVGSSSASASSRAPAYPPQQQQQQQRPTHRSTPSNGYSAESSYPPLPSFSRPSSSASTPSGGSSRSPPLHATFARLRALLAEQSPSLADTLSSPLSSHVDPALSSLRAALAPYELPRAVVDSYLEHDGQELLSAASSGGGAAGGARVGGLGLVYGLWWMPLDQVEQEWRFWRTLEDAGGLQGAGLGGDAFGASAAQQDGRRRRGGRAHPYVADEEEIGGRGVGGGKDGKGCDVPGMGSFPDGWVRKRYSHPGWLPLLTDRCGNYIGVDLDPPPPPGPPAAGTTTSPSSSASASHAAPGAPAAKARTYGQPGQVIAFGREIDDKVVLFPGDGPAGWARFLAAFVDDVERGEFARLGERLAAGGEGAAGAGDDDEWDEERASSAVQRGKAARRDSASDGSGSDDDWRGAQDDGLGDRGYFETGVYGEEVVGSGPGARSAQTWVVRTEYRRLAAKLDLSGGVIGILCERSRRKWRSLGVGSSVPQPRGMLPMRVPGRAPSQPLSVAVRASSATGIEAHDDDDDDDEPESATTERPALAPPIPIVNETDIHPAASSSVELVLSPPSPTAPLVDLPPLPPSRTSHDSARSHASSRGSVAGGDGYLRDPPRSPRSPRRALAYQQQQQQQRHARRPPPPPPAALDLPTFVDLDFTDVGGSGASRADGGTTAAGVVPKASWLLSSATDGRDALANAGTAALGRLSMSSSNGGGARSPTLLPVALSRAESDEQYHHHQQAHAQRGIALTERGSSSRTALVGAEGGAMSPTDLEGGEGGGSGGSPVGASPVERVQVVSHRA